MTRARASGGRAFQRRIVRRAGAACKIERKRLLGRRQALTQGVDAGARRGAEDGGAQDLFVLQHAADRVVGHGVEIEALIEMEARPRHVEQRQQHERAVLLEEIIVGAAAAQLPDVAHHEIDLGGCERQLVFPDVAALEIAVAAHEDVIGLDRIIALVAADQAADGEEHADVLAGHRTVVHGIGGERQGALAAGRVDAQEGVPEHRGRVVEIGGGEDQRRRSGVDRGEPGVQRGADGFFAAVAVGGERQAAAQPAPAGGPEAARIAVGAGGRCRERFEGSVELGRGIGGAVGRQEEGRIVDEALRGQRPGPLMIVEQCQPLRVVRQVLRPSLRAQRVGFGRHSRSRRREQRREHDKKSRRPKGGSIHASCRSPETAVAGERVPEIRPARSGAAAGPGSATGRARPAPHPPSSWCSGRSFRHWPGRGCRRPRGRRAAHPSCRPAW